MNFIYLLVWNRSLRVLQVTSELARASRGGTGSSATPAAMRRRFKASAALAFLLMFGMTSAAQAQDLGGDGGSGGQRPLGPGGEGGTSANPDGSPGGSNFSSGGGGGGGGSSLSVGTGGSGGAGGISIGSVSIGAGGAGGGVGSTTATNNAGTIDGGAGMNGGIGGAELFHGNGSGGGGGGGFGLVLGGSGLANNLGRITGGAGGAGGEGGGFLELESDKLVDFGGGAGGGGGGGGGVLLTGGASFTNSNAIAGGRGGDGGASVQGGSAGSGGDGGIGVALTGGGSLTNSGSIVAGAGGSIGSPAESSHYRDRVASHGGTAVLVTAGGAVLNTGVLEGGAGGVGTAGPVLFPLVPIAAGAGGAGVVATGNVSIINAGSISGGLSGNGTTRANAIDFFGGNNTLTLQAGYGFNGHVVSTSGATNGGDTLTLGGDTTPSAVFDVSGIVGSLSASYAGTQFVGFSNFVKSGASSWVLTGRGSTGQNWSIVSGSLQGDADTFAGNISFAPDSPSANASVVFNQGPVPGVYGGTISGEGSVVKINGTLALTGTNTYSGGTTILAGKLSVAADANLGAASGALTFDGGMLQVTGTAFTSTARPINWGANGGAFEIVDGNATFGVAQALTGTGPLVKEGAGTLVLSGANSYTGGTTHNAGTLVLDAAGSLAGPIVNNATLEIASADTGAITSIQNNAALNFRGAGSAGQAAITNNATADFFDTATAGNAVITTAASGTTRFHDRSTTAQAWFVTAAGGLVDFSQSAGPAGDGRFSAGSIEGAGRYALGANQLTVGGNNLSTVASGPIDGAGGSLVKIGTGTLTLTGENSYSGGTDLKQGGIAVGNNSALGTGELAMHEGTTLRFAADGLTLANPIAFTDAVDPIVDTGAFTATLTGAITGPGDLSKIGSGTLILSGANSYGGATAVTEGTLRAGAANTFSPASAHSVAPGATLDLAGFSQSIAGLTNAGTVSLIGTAPGTTLTVTGPYVGNNGLLRLGTFLGDSASASDRLVLSGPAAVASGRTTVQVVNLGGLGALTTGNGIELVSALNGATTTAQSTRDAFALQGGHVDAGAYEYRLQPGDAAGVGENWYLRSTSTVVVPPIPPAPPSPPSPDSPPSPPSPSPVAPPATIQVPTYRAEVPLFAALPEQLRQGSLAMLGSLHQRIGDDDMRSPVQANPAQPGSERRAWGRVLSTGRNIRQGGTVSPYSEGRLSGVQAGTDLWSDARWRAGLYAGQLDGELQVEGFARGLANLPVGSNDLRSQYLGGYATYGNDGGFYADAVLQAGRHRYEVKPQGNLRAKGKGSSLSASLEIGQSFALAEGWQIEPQAQLVHQRLDLDDVDIAGARVRQAREGSWLARVGVRVKGDIATSAGRLQPYARVNLYRASGGDDSTRFINPAASTAIDSSRGGSSTGLAAGFTLGLSESTSLYGEVGKLWASGGDTRVKSQLNASVGLRVRW